MTSEDIIPGEDSCAICGEDNPTMLRTHELVPEEYYEDGSEDYFRTVLCANHKAVLESLYDETVFKIVTNSVDVDGGNLGWGKTLAEDINNGNWPNRDELEVLPGLEIYRLFNQTDSLKDTREVLLTEYARRRRKMDIEYRNKIKNLKQLIADIEDEYAEGAPVDEVIGRCSDIDLGESEVEAEIEKLRKKGEVYEPRTDYLRTT